MKIRLAPFSPQDRDALLVFMNDLEIFRNTLRIPYPYTERDADAWLDFVLSEQAPGKKQNNWAIRSENSEVLMGGIGFLSEYPPARRRDEIGYWLGKPYRGKGIMTQAITLILDIARQRGLQMVEAKVFSHNNASMRSLEKAGFSRIRILDAHMEKLGEKMDVVLFEKSI